MANINEGATGKTVADIANKKSAYKMELAVIHVPGNFLGQENGRRSAMGCTDIG